MSRELSTTTDGRQTAPPVARKLPVTKELHGDLLVDDYAWMRDRNNPELLPHLVAENAYADAYMAGTKALQDRLYQEMRGRIREADTTVPTKRGRYLYYERTEEGKQYRKYCRKKDKPNSSEEVFLDIDLLAEGHKYFAL